MKSPTFMVLSAAVMVSGLVIAAIGPIRWIGLVLVVAGLVLLGFSSLSVVLDDEALNLAYGPFGWPRQRFDRSSIVSASAVQVQPMRWGGWGYRGSLRLFGRAAVILRAGPGLRILLDNDREFVVTVDDPETPAAALNHESPLPPNEQEEPNRSSGQ